jgi:hypothetical protein
MYHMNSYWVVNTNVSHELYSILCRFLLSSIIDQTFTGPFYSSKMVVVLSETGISQTPNFILNFMMMSMLLIFNFFFNFLVFCVYLFCAWCCKCRQIVHSWLPFSVFSNGYPSSSSDIERYKSSIFHVVGHALKT